MIKKRKDPIAWKLQQRRKRKLWQKKQEKQKIANANYIVDIRIAEQLRKIV